MLPACSAAILVTCFGRKPCIMLQNGQIRILWVPLVLVPLCPYLAPFEYKASGTSAPGGTPKLGAIKLAQRSIAAIHGQQHRVEL
jgi:hypothetical protein